MQSTNHRCVPAECFAMPESLPSAAPRSNEKMPGKFSRNQFLASLAGAAASAADPPFRTDAARLRRHIEELNESGRPEGGTFGSGVNRVGFSDADVAGRGYIMRLMREAGVDPKIDTAGNISAIRPGDDASATPVLFGSHIDSVPGGGNFDGDLGVLGAIEVLHALRGIRTRRPLEIVVLGGRGGNRLQPVSVWQPRGNRQARGR